METIKTSETPLGTELKYIQCSYDDIQKHYNVCKPYVDDVDENVFKDRMKTCIDAGTAFTVPGKNIFLYYINYKPCCADGVALYGKDYPIELMTLFKGIFTDIDTNTFKIDFNLHQGKLLEEYKSLLTWASIERYSAHNAPIVIRVDHLKKQWSKLF